MVYLYYNKVEISGVNTSQLKVLRESEKMELLKKVKQGDMQAREELINGNHRLVLSVIQRFAGRGEGPGRPVSGRVYRSDQGNRQLRHHSAGQVLNLCRSDDTGRTPALPSRQFAGARQPLNEGSRLPGYAGA